MSISALRSAIAAAGGTATQWTHVGLLRELISAWGGTPTKRTINDLLKEAIAKVGGTATQNSQLTLLRELVSALGGSPVSFVRDDLWAQVASLAANGNGTSPLTAPVLVQTSPATTNPMSWQATYGGSIEDDGAGNGDRVRMRWRVNGGAWTTEADQGLTEAILLAGGFSWPLFDAHVFAGGDVVDVQEQKGRFVGGVETSTSNWSNMLTDTMAAITPWPSTYFTGGTPPAGAYWDVSDISTLFKDTAGTVPVTADGDIVLRINDKSGNGHHLTVAANGPTYRPDAGGAGKPYLDFDGVNDVMSCAAFTVDAQPNFYGFAIRPDSVASVQFVMDGLDGTNENRIGINSANNSWQLKAGTTVSYTSGPAPVTNPLTLTVLFNGSSSYVRQNGVQSSQSLNPNTQGIGGIVLGAAFGLTNFFDGRFYGGFYLATTPDATNLAAAEGWLNGLHP